MNDTDNTTSDAPTASASTRQRHAPPWPESGRGAVVLLDPFVAEFLDEHAIDHEVAAVRGYHRYGTGEDGVRDLEAADPGYQRAPRSAVKFRTRSPGIAIVRRAFPGTTGPTPLAELRPDVPLVMRTRLHVHEDAADGHEHGFADPFVPCHGGAVDECEHDRDDHHAHPDLAKYVFMRAEMIERLSLHAVIRGDFWTGQTAAAAAERALEHRLGHGLIDWDRAALAADLGVELPPREPAVDAWIASALAARDAARAEGRKDYAARLDRQIKRERLAELRLGSVFVDGVEFAVYSRMRRARDSEAMRVDVHPTARERLQTARRVYFGLEGCPKADAMLSAILAADEDASVVSVPSVTLWPRDADVYTGDLRLIALHGMASEVVIVVDGDWDDPKNRGAVLAQASRLQHTLARLGVPRVAIAAPPLRLGKGVDDMLANGGTLADLEVVPPQSADALLAKLRATHTGGEAAFEVVADVATTIQRRSNPHNGRASSTDQQIAYDTREPVPHAAPDGRPRREDEKAQTRRTAASRRRQTTRSRRALRAAGFRIEEPDPIALPNGRTLQPATVWTLPGGTYGVPATLGRLGDVGVPIHVLPDLRLERYCAECGERVESARRVTAAYCSAACRKAANRRKPSREG